MSNKVSEALFRSQPQLEFKLPKAATVEYFPDPDIESDTVVFKTEEGRIVLLMPLKVYKEWFSK
jgi:hypothetical protein